MRSIFAVFLLCVSGLVFADAEMTFSDGTVGLISDGKVMFGDADASILFTEGQDYFIVVESKNMRYTRVDKEFTNEISSQIDAQMEQMLASLPEGQRAMAEQQMKAMMPQMQEERATSARRTGESAEVANFDCDIVELINGDGTVDSVVCVATQDELGLSNADYRTLQGAMTAMQEMAAMGGGGSAENDLEELGGIPIRSQSAMHTSELVGFDDSSLDPARLQIPENFTEFSIQEMMQ